MSVQVAIHLDVGLPNFRWTAISSRAQTWRARCGLVNRGRKIEMIRLIAVAFTLALASTAQATPPVQVAQPDQLVTQVRQGCGAGMVRRAGVCVPRGGVAAAAGYGYSTNLTPGYGSGPGSPGYAYGPGAGPGYGYSRGPGPGPGYAYGAGPGPGYGYST